LPGAWYVLVGGVVGFGAGAIAGKPELGSALDEAR